MWHIGIALSEDQMVEKSMHGRTAFDLCVRVFAEMFAEGPSLPTIAMLQCLSGFRWMMSPEQEASYRSWMEMARASFGTSDTDMICINLGEVGTSTDLSPSGIRDFLS